MNICCLTLSYLQTQFDSMQQTTFENTVLKGEIVHNEMQICCLCERMNYNKNTILVSLIM